MTIVTSLGHPTNNIPYFDKSLNRKRFCCVKVVNCNSWAEFLSARLHPGLVEFSNAGLESLSWYFRCFKRHFGLEVARQKHRVVGWSSEFVQITSVCTRNSCKTLAPHPCAALTVQSGFCSWSFALQYLCFLLNRAVLALMEMLVLHSLAWHRDRAGVCKWLSSWY